MVLSGENFMIYIIPGIIAIPINNCSNKNFGNSYRSIPGTDLQKRIKKQVWATG